MENTFLGIERREAGKEINGSKLNSIQTFIAAELNRRELGSLSLAKVSGGVGILYNVGCSKKFCVYIPAAAPHHGTVEPNIGDRPILPGGQELTPVLCTLYFTMHELPQH